MDGTENAAGEAMPGTRIGQSAVEYDLLDSRGQRRTSAERAGTWQLLVFHRHLG